MYILSYHTVHSINYAFNINADLLDFSVFTNLKKDLERKHGLTDQSSFESPSLENYRPPAKKKQQKTKTGNILKLLFIDLLIINALLFQVYALYDVFIKQSW